MDKETKQPKKNTPPCILTLSPSLVCVFIALVFRYLLPTFCKCCVSGAIWEVSQYFARNLLGEEWVRFRSEEYGKEATGGGGDASRGVC